MYLIIVCGLKSVSAPFYPEIEAKKCLLAQLLYPLGERNKAEISDYICMGMSRGTPGWPVVTPLSIARRVSMCAVHPYWM